MNTKAMGLIVFFMLNFKVCHSRKYSGYSLYVTSAENLAQLQFLKNLESEHYIDMQYWKKPMKLRDDVHLMLNNKDIEVFMERCVHFGLNASVLIDDVQSAFDKQIIKRYAKSKLETFSWSCYYDLGDIYTWLQDLKKEFPKELEVKVIGKTINNREIVAVEIKKVNTNTNVIVEAGIHGNEWISVAFATYLIYTILYTDRTENHEVSNVLNNVQWNIIPVVNPDGYVYAHSDDRLWRKNRKMMSHNAYGVDLNRNFNFSFSKFGTSMDPEDEYYCGPEEFSEPETTAILDYVKSKKNKPKYYFSIHGYGQKIIVPYSDTVLHVDNYADAANLGQQAAAVIYQMSKSVYDVGTYYDVFGAKASGDSLSWVKKFGGVEYAFALLLRDNGTFGYALPANLIKPTCDEVLVGMMQILRGKIMKMSRTYDGLYVFDKGLHLLGCTSLLLWSLVVLYLFE